MNNNVMVNGVTTRKLQRQKCGVTMGTLGDGETTAKLSIRRKTV